METIRNLLSSEAWLETQNLEPQKFEYISPSSSPPPPVTPEHNYVARHRESFSRKESLFCRNKQLQHLLQFFLLLLIYSFVASSISSEVAEKIKPFSCGNREKDCWLPSYSSRMVLYSPTYTYTQTHKHSHTCCLSRKLQRVIEWLWLH